MIPNLEYPLPPRSLHANRQNTTALNLGLGHEKLRVVLQRVLLPYSTASLERTLDCAFSEEKLSVFGVEVGEVGLTCAHEVESGHL